jgi:hypothetical protein
MRAAVDITDIAFVTAIQLFVSEDNSQNELNPLCAQAVQGLKLQD